MGCAGFLATFLIVSSILVVIVGYIESHRNKDE